MPSLSGWMLGYPVAYLVDAANVSAAASWLSCADLALHRVTAVCSPLQVFVRPLLAAPELPGYVVSALCYASRQAVSAAAVEHCAPVRSV